MLLLLAAWLVASPSACRSQTTLGIPSTTSEQVSPLSPVSLAIPSSDTLLNLSIALCSPASPPPRFFVSNETGVKDPGIENAGQELDLLGGLAQWNGSGPATFYAYAQSGGTGNTTRSFQVGLTADEQIFRIDSEPPLLGDTTATQAIIFSPPFQLQPIDEPEYPNYTLPQANLSSPTPPTPPHQDLYVYQTSNISSVLAQVNGSSCGITLVPGNVVSFGKPLTKNVVLRDEAWRTQWVLEELSPTTNYTVFVVQDNAIISGPLYFLTKSNSFPCSLVHSLPFCPSVSYAVPLPPPSGEATTYTPRTLPSNLTDPLLSSMGNFTQSLLTFACGRDIYSPIQTCASCAAAYRSWLCAVSFPRCGESSVVNDDSPYPPALRRYSANSMTRSRNIGPLGQDFNELLPCVESCFSVARSCPSFLGWQCPANDVTANSSYGIGYIDAIDGPEGKGRTGASQDRFGNVWCNMP